MGNKVNIIDGTTTPAPSPCETMRSKIKALATKLIKCKIKNCLANKKSNLSKKEKYALGEGNLDTVNLAIQNLKDYKKEEFRLEEELQKFQARVGELERSKADCKNDSCINRINENILEQRDKEINTNRDLRTTRLATENSSNNLSSFLDGITCNT